MNACPGCGARYASPEDDCDARFAALLALDHARVEPWGSRHGLAFSAFVLQHADRHSRDELERAWLMLYSVYRSGVEVDHVVRGLRAAGKVAPAWDVPALPATSPPTRFPVTIADLGAFPAESYAAQLDEWCRATLAAWQRGAAEPPSEMNRG